MQNIVIVWRAFLVYLVGAGAETGASETGAFEGPALLGVEISCSEFPSSSGSLYPAERNGFLQGRGAIAAGF